MTSPSPIPNSITDVPENPRVLVVDDSQPDRARLCEILRRIGMAPIGAGSGREALACLESQSIDVVVSDWIMPGMSGLELCRQVIAEPRFGRPHFIMVTGRRQPADLIAGMDAGADDFLAKPVSREELRVRVQAGLRQLGLRRQLHLSQVALESTLAQETFRLAGLQRDLQAVSGLQRRLRAPVYGSIGGWNTACVAITSDVIGGNLLGLHAIGQHSLGLFSIDVHDQGVPAAMQSIECRMRLNPGPPDLSILTDPETGRPRTAAGVTQELAQWIHANADLAPMASAFACIDTAAGRGELCLAGHLPALMLRRRGGCEWIGDSSPAAGSSPQAQYGATEFAFEPGDRLLVPADAARADEHARDAVDDGLARALAAIAPGPGSLTRSVRAFLEHRKAHSAATGRGMHGALLIERPCDPPG